MAKEQRINIPTVALLDVLIAKGIVPSGTTRVSCWTGNVSGTNYFKIIVTNDAFTDLAPGDPIPDSTVDVVTGISNLSV